MPVSLTEEQIDLLANKIAHAITKALRELFEELFHKIITFKVY